MSSSEVPASIEIKTSSCPLQDQEAEDNDCHHGGCGHTPERVRLRGLQARSREHSVIAVERAHHGPRAPRVSFIWLPFGSGLANEMWFIGTRTRTIGNVHRATGPLNER